MSSTEKAQQSGQKNKPSSVETQKKDPFQDKRRLLSYWKSLDSPTTPDKEYEIGDNKDGLLDELKKCLVNIDDFDAAVVDSAQRTKNLHNEQLSLLNQLGDYVKCFSKEIGDLDLNENLKIDTIQSEHFTTLQEEKRLLLEENKNLQRQLKAKSDEYKSSSTEQQRDIEKLTREVQTSNISRKRLERELLQASKLKDENEATINSLRQELKTIKDSYEKKVENLRNINEQVSKDNSELVEKGRDATENLKEALQQLTDEKKALLEQKRSVSGKDVRELEASLERAKKERQTFRQRCEKSEIMQRSLQEEITFLKNDLKIKEDKLKSLWQKTEMNTARETGSGEEDGLSAQGQLESVQSRVSQLKNYVHVLEGRVKEKEENILALRKENARCNDVAMEKSLELSRTRRILERRIEKLVKENSEWKRKFLIPNSYDTAVEKQNIDIDTKTGSKQQQQQRQQGERQQQQQQFRRLGANFEKTARHEVPRIEERQRRKSNPERSAIETTLNGLSNISENTRQHRQLPVNNDIEVEKARKTTNDRDGQDSVFTPVEVRALDVAPKRRIGGKFIRATSKRHSADLGKLMSRQESATGRKSDSDLLHPRDQDEPSTVFVNRYRQKSEEEEHWV